MKHILEIKSLSNFENSNPKYISKSSNKFLNTKSSKPNHIGLKNKQKWILKEKELPILTQAHQELDEYFSKKRKLFSIPFSLEGTDFQIKAWKELCDIPYGEVISYSEQAKRIKNPKAIRCVGSTNGKNPIPIIIPCHRVIGKNGSLTGFGGGIEMKKYLLELENYKREL